MAKIRIILNGEQKEISQNTSLMDLIDDFGLDLKKIAIEKNLEIIQPEEFKNNILSAGDRIEIVHFIGGG